MARFESRWTRSVSHIPRSLLLSFRDLDSTRYVWKNGDRYDGEWRENKVGHRFQPPGGYIRFFFFSFISFVCRNVVVGGRRSLTATSTTASGRTIARTGSAHLFGPKPESDTRLALRCPCLRRCMCWRLCSYSRMCLCMCLYLYSSTLSCKCLWTNYPPYRG
jgi:hypothetical protein